MPASFRRSSTWFVRCAAEAWWSFNATANAGVTGFLNGSGRTLQSRGRDVQALAARDGKNEFKTKKLPNQTESQHNSHN